jgi:hypothetical protein
LLWSNSISPARAYVLFDARGGSRQEGCGSVPRLEQAANRAILITPFVIFVMTRVVGVTSEATSADLI